ncbi:hypothetical protein ACOSQ3_031266 [Xanthoceras sorbifolium]
MSRKKYGMNILYTADFSMLTWASECGSRTAIGHHPNLRLLPVLTDSFQENLSGTKSREVAQTLITDFLRISSYTTWI